MRFESQQQTASIAAGPSIAAPPVRTAVAQAYTPAMILLACTLLLGTAVANSPPGALAHAPPYTASDAAVIIEELDLDHAGQQHIVLQLVDDFSMQWTLLVDGYSVALGINPNGQTEEMEAASIAFSNAAHTSVQAAQAVRQLEADLKSADATQVAALQEALTNASALRARLLKEVRRASDARRALIHRDPMHVERTAQEFAEESAALTQQFEADIRLLLIPEQRERWDVLIPRFTMRQLLRAGHLGGEHLNLDSVVSRVHPILTSEELAVIEPTLVEWRTEIDAALENRSNHDYLAVPFPNVSQRSALATSRRAVRDCTLRHLDAACTAVGEPRGSQMRDLAMRIGFPARYRPTHMEQALEYCISAHEDQRDQIKSLLQSHAKGMKAVRAANIALLINTEGHGTLTPGTDQEGMQLPAGAGDAIRSIQDLRRRGVDQPSLDRLAFKQLERILGRAEARRAMRKWNQARR